MLLGFYYGNVICYNVRLLISFSNTFYLLNITISIWCSCYYDYLCPYNNCKRQKFNPVKNLFHFPADLCKDCGSSRLTISNTLKSLTRTTTSARLLPCYKQFLHNWARVAQVARRKLFRLKLISSCQRLMLLVHLSVTSLSLSLSTLFILSIIHI